MLDLKESKSSGVTRYQVRETRDALYFRSQRSLAIWERILAGAILAAVILLIAKDYFTGWWAVGLGISAGMGISSLLPSERADLRVSKLELAVSKPKKRGGKVQITVFTADMRRIEFQSDGLYAVTDKKSICVLPFLDFDEATEIIRAIETKFPWLAERWHSGDSKESTSHFPTLGI